ncbi:MAG: hypothetical protein ABW250_26765 [Pyrinomonadaceae bacterium]
MKELTLEVGYTDAQGTVHREVVFGKRLLGADLFEIDEHPLAVLKTNREHLFLTRAITKFGDLKMPVAPTVFLALDSIDRDDLVEAYNQLEGAGSDGRRPEALTDRTLRLGDGLTMGGVVYDVVEFGVRLTGKDYVEADQQELDASRRAFYLVGRQVSRLSQTEGDATLSGPLTLEMMATMHVSDLYALRGGSEVWRQSFRRSRKDLQKDDGRDGVRTDGGDGSE